MDTINKGSSTDQASSTSTGRIRVIHTRGDDRAIGLQHAEQVGADVSRGMLSCIPLFWNELYGANIQKLLPRLTLATLRNAIEYLFEPLLWRQVGPGPRRRLRALAEGAKLTDKALKRMVLFPDVFPVLQSYWARLDKNTFMPGLGALGCTSFMAQGKRFLYGRNLDFLGVGYWDQVPVLQLTERTGARYRTLGFASAGVPLCGITGINEVGLTCALHQHYSMRSSLRGQLPFMVAEELLESCGTLEEARHFLEKRRVASAWAFVITGGKEQSGFVFEADAQGHGHRALDASVLTHSNYFQTAHGQACEYSASARMNWDNRARAARLRYLAESASPGLTASLAARFLGDHWDPFWEEEKVLNRTVSQGFNIQSVVLDPRNMKAWVAEGGTPIHLSHYVEFDLGEIFAGREGRGAPTPGFRFRHEKLAESKRAYAESVGAGMVGDAPRAQRTLDAALEAAYTPELAFIQGIWHLKNADYRGAFTIFSKAVQFLEEKVKAHNKKHPPEYFECALFKARSLDLLGRRQEALREYARIEAHSDLEDRAIRHKARRAPSYGPRDVSLLVAPYSSYIPLQ